MLNSLDLLFWVGRPISPLYGLVMKLREKLYKKCIFHQYRLPVPVISVGNLVLGGTGKTPTVRYLAELLKSQGYRPAVISRGYGGKLNNRINIVSDTCAVYLDPEQSGDEPYMLARSLPGIPVLTGKRRIHPSRVAIDKYNSDILILDDGFQHLALHRDIDIVLFDGTNLAGNSRIFPGGVLREPVSALERCDVFLLTGITGDNREKAERFGALLQKRFTKKPVFYSSIGNYCLKGHAAEASIDFEEKHKYYAFCGIANPARFENSLKSLGVRVTGFQALPDHSLYNQRLLDTICENALRSGAQVLVTTEKDFVKIQKFITSLPLTVLEIRAQEDRAFDSFIFETLQSLQDKTTAK